MERPKDFPQMPEGIPTTTIKVTDNSMLGRVKAAYNTAAGKIRGLYNIYDDDLYQTSFQIFYGGDAGLCANFIQDDCCFDQTITSEDYFGVDLGFSVGPCAECAYGSCGSPYLNSSSSCYTCPSGHTLMTYQMGSCLGFCVPNAEVDSFTAVFSNYTSVTDSDCRPYGSKYPLDCFPSDDGDDAVCFSGVDTVQLESGETKMLSEVQVGDRVLSADAKGALSYTDVVFLPHAANNKAATFANIATEGGKALKATKTHLVQTCSGDLAYAGALKAGDCLRTVDGDERIASTSVTKAEGIYSVVAQNEFVVVSGIVSSPFAFAHGATNAVYNLHRALYKFAPALLKSSAVVSANAVLGAAAVLAANLFTQAK